MVLSLLPCLLTVTGSPTRDHSFLPFVPVLRNIDPSCTAIVNPRFFAHDIVPAAPACHCLTESASVAEAYMAADLLDKNPRRRRILRTLHETVPGIKSPAYPVPKLSGGEHVLAGKPVDQFPDPPVPRAWRPSPSGSVPEATDAALVEPRYPQLDRAPIHVCEVRRVLCGVSREYSAHCHHPVADPGVLLCTHGLRQLPDLLVSLAHGWIVDLVIKKLFCLTALQAAKLFVSVTLVFCTSLCS